MLASKLSAPHFYVQRDVDVTRLTATRTSSTGMPSVTDYLVAASVFALIREPAFNAVWEGESLVRRETINLGLAVETESGLVAPALLDCAAMSLVDISAARRDIVARAGAGQLRPAELTEGTFTLSNLGTFGVTSFTAIINPPQVAILATGALRETLALRGTQVISTQFITVTLSADHRAIDGADAARFLARFAEGLSTLSESPLGE